MYHFVELASIRKFIEKEKNKMIKKKIVLTSGSSARTTTAIQKQKKSQQTKIIETVVFIKTTI